MPRPSLVHPVGDAGREFCMHVSNYAADLHAAFKVRVITSACGRLHDISRLLSSACTRCSANWGLRQTSVQAQCYYAAVVPLCILCRWPPVLGISGISLPCVDRDAMPCIVTLLLALGTHIYSLSGSFSMLLLCLCVTLERNSNATVTNVARYTMHCSTLSYTEQKNVSRRPTSTIFHWQWSCKDFGRELELSLLVLIVRIATRCPASRSSRRK
jgi:hypothetical protein